MHFPFVRRPKPIFDYEHVVDRFCDNLLELRDHLVKHNLVEGVDEMEAQIDKAVILLNGEHGFIEGSDFYLEYSFYDEDRAWHEGWRTVRRLMRNWWD